MLRRATLAALLLGVGCKEDPPPPSEPAAEPAPPVPLPTTVANDPTHLVIHHADQLDAVDLEQVRILDLAMSPTDQVGHLDQIDPETVCTRLDLVKLAARVPSLQRLRISGCQEAVHAGLGALGERLRVLELADLTLDGVTIGNLARLTGLHTLTLSRVDAGPDPLLPLRALPLRRLVLRELQRDSEITTMIDLWPRSLTHVELEGEWAGHTAMITLSRAEALEVLELRNTRVSNFSLNQIKGLLQLREVVFEGSTFNDKSPLYFKDLPMERFSCTCRRFGDLGLRSLRHSHGIRRLELRETAVTGAGLEVLGELAHLEALVLLDRDLGEEGLGHLASLSKLTLLELSGPIADPSLAGLSALAGLHTLRLSHPELDDRAAPQLQALTQLRWLDLGGTRISDEGLSALAALTELRTLHLDHTRITNRGLAHLAKLHQLEELSLQSTDVVDEGVAHLVELQRLHTLRLDRTLVTDAVIDTLVQLRGLRRLNLAHTVVTAEGVARLRSLPALEVLELTGIRG
ncbi:MAG: hypothetical protein KDK70_04665 [Myxococcales bacterium]|nr:hypothetical protein [Myxococcales bacterium]